MMVLTVHGFHVEEQSLRELLGALLFFQLQIGSALMV